MIEAILWLVINTYFESNIEPLPAQIATVQVVMNRADWKPENVKAVIIKRKQFSWTDDPSKMKLAQGIISSGKLPDEMIPLVRVVYKAITVPFYERTIWTHYQIPGVSQRWGCWTGGVKTKIFPGSGHIFCGDLDVVKPGNTPAYIKKRAKLRAWRKRKELSDNDRGGC